MACLLKGMIYLPGLRESTIKLFPTLVMMNVNVLFIIVGALCTCGVSVPEAESDLHVKLAELSANITKIKVMV